MNYVYKLIFNKRKNEGIMPYMYIGSKSNALYKNGIILDKNGNAYYGSSCYKGYHDIVKEEIITVEIIKEFDNYTDALNYESMIQRSLDVVANPEYFNLGIATINNFTDPNYSTYKNIYTEKIVRLPRNHPKVLSKEYVGVSKGVVLTEEERKSRGRKGKENPFYGRKHTVETTEKIVSSRRETYENDPEKFDAVRKILSETAKKTFTGVPKTEEQKKKMGRKNLVMLKNRLTEETIRIPKEQKHLYDDVWVNPYVLSENKPFGSRWTTNGIENKKIKKDEKVPDGFWYGRTMKWKDI